MARWSQLVVVAGLNVGGALAFGASVENRLPGTVDTVLTQATELELLSLEPQLPSTKPRDAFHGYKVLGRTRVQEPQLKDQLLAAIRQGISESAGAVAVCFNPRHGVRAISGRSVVDLVICFECLQIQPYLDGKQVDTALTTRSPQALLDQVLRSSNVPLAATNER